MLHPWDVEFGCHGSAPLTSSQSLFGSAPCWSIDVPAVDDRRFAEGSVPCWSIDAPIVDDRRFAEGSAACWSIDVPAVDDRRFVETPLDTSALCGHAGYWGTDVPTVDESRFAEGLWAPRPGEILEPSLRWKEEDTRFARERWTPAAADPSTSTRQLANPTRRSRGRRQRHRRLEKIAREVAGVVLSDSGTGAASSSAFLTGDSKPLPLPPNQGRYTTAMLRNIPKEVTQEMLVEQLQHEFPGMFDFLYLPLDFKKGCNVGYGFINFRSVGACEIFFEKVNGVDLWEDCYPGKAAEVTPARIQGLQENVYKLRNSPVMNELYHRPDWMPRLMDEHGQEIVFPMPDTPCPPVKPRRRGRQDDLV